MPNDLPTESPRLTAAIERIRFSRGMTESMLENLGPDDWFFQPGEGMNPIAWHVGHLAFAMYFLCLKRLRGRIVEDEPLISTKFLKRYKQGSQPSGDPEANFSPEEIRAVFDGVLKQTLAELPGYTDADLEAPSAPPHPVFETKLGAVEWCSQHELMHCGQIVLLRRLRGKTPRW